VLFNRAFVDVRRRDRPRYRRRAGLHPAFDEPIGQIVDCVSPVGALLDRHPEDWYVELPELGDALRGVRDQAARVDHLRALRARAQVRVDHVVDDDRRVRARNPWSLSHTTSPGILGGRGPGDGRTVAEAERVGEGSGGPNRGRGYQASAATSGI